MNEQHVSAMTAGFQVMAREMGKMVAAYAKAMGDFMQTPSGQYLKAVCDYYDRHPEELDLMVAAREAEAQTSHSCHCLCQKWNHLGTCTGEAGTHRMFGSAPVPLCTACAASVDAQTGGVR